MTRGHRAGMTLIEVLVTLGIVGVMATLVILGLGVSGGGLTVQTEANRLADRVGFAADEVMVTRRPLALVWDAQGYAFVRPASDGSWVPDDHALLGERHDLPGGLTLASDAPSLILLDPETTTPFQLTLGDARHSSAIMFDGLTATIVATPAS